MALFDALGNNDNPLFVGFKPSQGLDNRMALSYLDKKSELKPNLGTAPKMSDFDLKGTGASTKYLENQILTGRAKVRNAIKKAGNNVKYAMTTDEYKEGMQYINATNEEINRLENELKERNDFQTKIQADNTGSQLYVGDGSVNFYSRMLNDEAYTNSDIIFKTENEGLDYKTREKHNIAFTGSYGVKEHDEILNKTMEQVVNSYTEWGNLGTTKMDKTDMEVINGMSVLTKSLSKSNHKDNLQQLEAKRQVVNDMFTVEQLQARYGDAFFNQNSIGGTDGKVAGIKSFGTLKKEYKQNMSNAVNDEEKKRIHDEYLNEVDLNFRTYAALQIGNEFMARKRTLDKSGVTMDLEQFGEDKATKAKEAEKNKKINAYQNYNDAVRAYMEAGGNVDNLDNNKAQQVITAGVKEIMNWGIIQPDGKGGVTDGKNNQPVVHSKNKGLVTKLNNEIIERKKSNNGNLDIGLDSDELIMIADVNGGGKNMIIPSGNFFNVDGTSNSQEGRIKEYTGDLVSIADKNGEMRHMAKAIYVIDPGDLDKQSLPDEYLPKGTKNFSDFNATWDSDITSRYRNSYIDGNGMLVMEIWVDKTEMVNTGTYSDNSSKYERTEDTRATDNKVKKTTNHGAIVED